KGADESGKALAIDLKVAADFGLGKNGGQEVARIDGDKIKITTADGRTTLKEIVIPKSAVLPYNNYLGAGGPEQFSLARDYNLLAPYQLAGDANRLYVIGGTQHCVDGVGCVAKIGGSRVVEIDPRTGAVGAHKDFPHRIVTAADFAVVDGQRSLALGFSRGGVEIWNPDNWSQIPADYSFEDWSRDRWGPGVGWARDAVSALKYGDIGNSRIGLAIGRLGFNAPDDDRNPRHMVYLLDATSRYEGMWEQQIQSAYGSGNVLMPTSFAFGQLTESSGSQLAVGYYKEGTKAPESPAPRVQVLSVDNDGREDASRPSEGIAEPVGLDALQFVSRPGTNAQNLVVGAWNGQHDQVLRGNGTQGLDPLTLPNGQQTADEQTLRDWFPGYRGGLFTVKNDTGAPVYFSLKSAEDETAGCWLNKAAGRNQAIPSGLTPLGQGESSPDYYSAALLKGGTGDTALKCGDPGRRFTYVTVEPEGKPGEGEQALRTIVKLEVSDDKVAVV
ncbi:hypothetical protein, partial [Streptomyces sp. NPDC001774]